jgi:hypothetical protein
MYGPWRQAEVLQGPRVQLSNGLDSTKEKANLAAGRALEYSRFIDPGAQTRMGTSSSRTCNVKSATYKVEIRGTTVKVHRQNGVLQGRLIPQVRSVDRSRAHGRCSSGLVR